MKLASSSLARGRDSFRLRCIIEDRCTFARPRSGKITDLPREKFSPFFSETSIRFSGSLVIAEGGISVKSWRRRETVFQFLLGKLRTSENWIIVESVLLYRFTGHSRETRFFSDKWSRSGRNLYFDKGRGFVRSKYIWRDSGKSEEDREKLFGAKFFDWKLFFHPSHSRNESFEEKTCRYSWNEELHRRIFSYGVISGS